MKNRLICCANPICLRCLLFFVFVMHTAYDIKLICMLQQKKWHEKRVCAQEIEYRRRDAEEEVEKR